MHFPLMLGRRRRFSRSSALAICSLVLLSCLVLSRLDRVDSGFTAVLFDSATVVRMSDDDLLHSDLLLVPNDEDDFSSTLRAPATPHREPLHKPDLTEGECIPELEYLKRPELGLGPEVVLTRRCIKPIWSEKIDRNEITNVSRPLVIHQLQLNLSSCGHVDFVPCDHLTLTVPDPYPEQQYAHLLFGVATSSTRLRESVGSFSHWLAGSEARLVGVVTDAGTEGGAEVDLMALRQLYESYQISATFVKPRGGDLSIPELHFTLVRDLLEHAADGETEPYWLGILDDDTFFPSLYPLDEALGQLDHTKPLYVGALSEDFRAIQSYGHMAFGGAGVFVSLALANELEPYVDDCLAQAKSNEGDTILRDCIYTHTHTKLTPLRDLHQQDMEGDVGGFFEAGLRPLSLHHWKSWYHAPVDRMAAITSLCGDCFLQRWRFGDDTVFTNGYSIAVYKDGTQHLDLQRMEGTWDDPEEGIAGGAYDFSVGPLRQKLGRGKKKAFVLVDAQVTDGGSLRQVYAYKGDKSRGEIDHVIEMSWEP